MADKTDIDAAKAHKERLKLQAGYSSDNRDRMAISGAAQRNHVAAAVLHVILNARLTSHPLADRILNGALDLLEGDGYSREATEARFDVMARQPRRKLKPPKPKKRPK